MVRGDCSAIRLHAADAAPVVMNGGNLEILKNMRAAIAGALGKRLGDIDGVGVAVAGDMNTADHIIEIGERVERMNVRRPDHVDSQAEHLGHGLIALEFFHARGGGRRGEGTASAIARALSGLGLQTQIQLAGVARQLSHVDALAQLATRPAACQVVPLVSCLRPIERCRSTRVWSGDKRPNNR